MENKVICPKPFTTIYNRPGRNYSPCCWGVPSSTGNSNEILPIDHFNGEEFKRLRKEMLEGERTNFLYSYCKHCFDREDEVGYSPRTELKKITPEIIKSFNNDGSIVDGTKNRFITIAINVYTNSCNLQCYECDILESTSRKKAIDKILTNLNEIGISEEDLSHGPLNKNLYFNPNNNIQFEKIINQLLEYADNIACIELVGGEPMLMKSHFTLLDKLIENNKSKDISLSYVSNMTLMTLDKMKYYFDNFHYTKIRWSVDALKERNYWLRYPTNWETTTKNVLEVQSYLKSRNGDILASITPSLLAISTLKKTYSWLLIRNLINKDLPIFNNVVKPTFLRTRNLPDQLKEEIGSNVQLISKTHYEDLIQDRNEHEFQLAVKYFDLLDQSRGTNWRETFPEIAKYVN